MVDSWTDSWRNLHLLSFMVSSVEGIFFLGSADASYLSDDSDLADLIEDRIESIGRDKVVQVVTDNSHRLRSACRLLMERIPLLFWTPGAFQRLDLMLKEIGRLEEFKKHIQQAKRVTTFIYRHGRLLCTMCDKIGRKELVAPTTTQYATSFLTLERMYKHKDAVKCLFTNEDWSRSKLSSTETGATVREIVLSPTFWNGVEDCIKASQQLLVLMRMVYGSERPAMPEVFVGLDLAKKKISDSFESNPGILKKIMDIIEQRWGYQMEQKLYGTALFFNPRKFFDIKETDHAYASSLQVMFNDMIEKMIADDDDLIAKVSDLPNQYESTRSSFGKKLPTLQRKKKSPMTGGVPMVDLLKNSKKSHGILLVFLVWHLAMTAIGL
uniref:DUF659 domain-containing protein n=1 Tax=Arundo donax TaxID=35708 RepID=A0A0A8Z2W1_ARUDO